MKAKHTLSAETDVSPETDVATDPSGPRRCSFVMTSMPVGGAETLLVNLLRAFDPSRVQPEVICLKQPGPLGEIVADEFPLHSGFLKTKWDASVAFRLVRHFRRQRTDVVITVGAGDKMFWGRLAARLAGVPGIASALHSTGWPDGVGRLNRMLTPITDAFVAVADAHGDHLIRHERFPAGRVHVIPNGVDCDRFVPSDQARARVRKTLGVAPETRVVGIVAALRPEKNHELFVEAAAAAAGRFPDCEFWIIGDGPRRSNIEAAIDRLGMEHQIRLLGTRADTPDLLAAMDGFALTSLNEASPVSILEAMAAQLPVICTDVGSVRSSVLAGKTGWIVPSKDRPAMTSAMLELLQDTERGRAFGKAGRTHVRQTGSLENMTRGYTQLIQHLAQGKRKSRTNRMINPAGTLQ
ncbi:MAG: glycosyltransferase [Planctomycetota bacterium]